MFKFHGVITTFEMIMADCPELKKIHWRCVVIDEAHRLKNRNCKLLEGLKLMNLVREDCVLCENSYRHTPPNGCMQVKKEKKKSTIGGKHSVRKRCCHEILCNEEIRQRQNVCENSTTKAQLATLQQKHNSPLMWHWKNHPRETILICINM